MFKNTLSLKEGAGDGALRQGTVFGKENGQAPIFRYEDSVPQRAFGRLLREAISRTKLSLRSWSAQKSTLTPGQISNIVSGERTPDLDLVAGWADSFGMEGIERQRFIDFAALAHLPPAVEDRFLLLLATHGETIEEYRQLGVPLKIPTVKDIDRKKKRIPTTDPSTVVSPSTAARSADDAQRQLESQRRQIAADAQMPDETQSGSPTVPGRRRFPRRPRGGAA